MNLIDDAWIPALRNGQSTTIALHEITDPGVTAIHGLPVDLHVGLLEMLVAMFTMAMTNPDIDDWHDLLESPPSADDIRVAFAPYRAAFNLLGDGPRFMQMPCPQEPTDLKAANPISTLIWGSAGDNTVKKNLDIIVHRDEEATLAPAMAAIALYSDLTRIQGSGAGNLSNIRKSNHVSFLVDLSSQYPQAPLWATIWGNVPCLEQGPLSPNSMEGALPWMRGDAIASSIADLGSASLQTERPDIERYFATPRRIWLLENDEGNVASFLRKKKGFFYDDTEWSHPHSPYIQVNVSGSKVAPAPYKMVAENFPRMGAYELVAQSIKQIEPEVSDKQTAVLSIPAIQRAKIEVETSGSDLQVIVVHQLADNAEMMGFSIDAGTQIPENPEEALALFEFDRVIKRTYAALEDSIGRLLAGNEKKSVPKLPSAFSLERGENSVSRPWKS